MHICRKHCSKSEKCNSILQFSVRAKNVLKKKQSTVKKANTGAICETSQDWLNTQTYETQELAQAIKKKSVSKNSSTVNEKSNSKSNSNSVSKSKQFMHICHKHCSKSEKNAKAYYSFRLGQRMYRTKNRAQLKKRTLGRFGKLVKID